MAFFTTSLRRAGATRLLAAASLALALAACGESAPSTFNASGTTDDVGSVSSAFDSPVLTSFSALGTQMDATTGTPSASVGVFAMRGKSGVGLGASAQAFVAQARRLLPQAPAAGFSAAGGVLPAEVLGKTFVWDEAQAKYVESALPGAPSNGVRFVLYAVDPVSGTIVSPLTETGHVDLVDLSSGSTRSARLEVVSGSTTYLSYTAAGTVTATGGDVRVNGFVTNGTTRANFDLDTKVSGTTTSQSITLDHSVDVPSRNVKLHYFITLTNTASSFQTSVNLSLKGPNGWVDLKGQESEGTGGTYTVKVNGDTFATITTDGGSTITITGKDGQPLTSDEQNALQRIFQVIGDGFELFTYFLAPLANFFG